MDTRESKIRELVLEFTCELIEMYQDYLSGSRDICSSVNLEIWKKKRIARVSKNIAEIEAEEC